MKPNFLHQYKLSNKYGNIPKRYGDRLYHSTLEANYAQTLDLMKKGGLLKTIKPQPKFSLDVNGVKIGHIIPDFYTLDKDGLETIWEVKSSASMTPLWKLKWKIMQINHPEFIYKIIQRGDF